ncbi:DNA internalization-related competence protein ComEC/Rec2 [Candidatus Contubernalis alkaliaceticus]|uniref:DNA internalization-related competence protein ComEC/Rec2 n=1 Tax=Candidatus Contubernalis alkaliaceticus TaxID=338645 RepID=UPI001F4C4FE4|nr:DNA internalization-related competence protein ComEC/Rec2 [Candidatus Contubernalis alkalaceticus]UNC93262.1 DNA internalization-related competence protein ComEC/Rec2 [Candidatus Contubernalis alkalaceticus]
MWSDLKEEAEKRPLLLCSAFFLVGIALGKILWELDPFLLLYYGVLVFLAAVLLFLYRSFLSSRLIIILLLFLLAGSLNFYRSVYVPKNDISRFSGSHLSVTGIVWDEPMVDGKRTSFDLKVQEVDGASEGQDINNDLVPQTVSGKIRVTLYGAGEQLHYGDRVRIRGELERPPQRRNPGGFDYRFYLLTQGISTTLRTEFGQAERLEGGGGNPHVYYSLSLRRNLLRKIEQGLPPQEGALLGGILLGNREGISKAMQEDFQRAGIGHLLAVSGLHVGLVAGIFLALFKFFKVRDEFSWAFTLLIILIYLGVIGFKASALRASLLLLLGGGAFLLRREKDPLTALAAAALILLTFKPLWLFTLSFQLSFSAALSILLLMPFLESITIFIPAPLRKILCVTLAAQLGVFPLTAYYFYQVSLVSLLANVLILPVVGVVVSLGFLSIFVSLLFPGLEFFFFDICRLLLSYCINTAGILSEIPGAYLTLNPPSYLFFLLYYVFLFLLLPWEYLRQKLKQCRIIKLKEFTCSGHKALPFALSLTVLLIWFPVFSETQQFSVVFLDVGQGDAAFIRTPSGRHILIDAGGRPAYLQTEEYGTEFVGERVVVPFLRHQGVKKLDMVILSHPHEDHYGGLLAVVDHFPVELFVTTRAQSDYPLFLELMEKIEEKNIPLLYLEAGNSISSPELDLELFNPPKSGKLFQGTTSDLNNNSLVFRLTAGDIYFLFTGDAEQEAEEYMLKTGFDLKSQMLKVGHHGARSSSGEEFLEAVRPEFAVIQVGRNSFGHPSLETLERLENIGCNIYRNDLHGAVTVKIKGDCFWVKPFIEFSEESSF